ncbi:MAG: type 3 dihydrofolate reductase [Methylococcaceae bacterium]|nr:type 3 dihydrofolate reductase [Methylococcaceae bacterium]
MKLSLIVAMSSNRVIGVDNRLPWHFSADLQRFKRITMGKPILMGRHTHESIGRPLPGRHNIVLTTDPDYQAAGCTVVHSLEAAFEAAGSEPELMVIGGSALYERLLPRADRLYLTLIDREFTGDTFFPEFLWEDWQEVERVAVDNDPTVFFHYRFVVLDRRD